MSRRIRRGRAVRVEDELWEPALEAAEWKGETLSEHVIRPALEAYVRRVTRERAAQEKVTGRGERDST